MKRRDLLRHLNAQGCDPLREGANHSVWANLPAGTVSTIPRHREINDRLALKICRDLKIDPPP